MTGETTTDGGILLGKGKPIIVMTHDSCASSLTLCLCLVSLLFWCKQAPTERWIGDGSLTSNHVCRHCYVSLFSSDVFAVGFSMVTFSTS